MTPERWKQVEAVLEQALERPTGERASFLDAACGDDQALRQQVETLIGSYDRAGSFIDRPVFGEVPDDNGGSPLIGQRLGSYKIVRELGRGGMGAVYLAVRADDEFQKRVAIKLVKRGMDTDFILRRFRQERQILASLDHPYIARLFDGGTTPDGLPYFVMEYIEGQTLHHYCDAHKSSTIERLRLFERVCAAVQYAHQNLIIHRDLKPSNVLVTADGTPKLLDFGIAKLLNPEMGGQTLDPTTMALRLMTPEYASPEQVRGETVTVTSDVYSLGVLLYELLTGHRPYRLRSRTPQELARAVCEQEPERPSVAINAIEVLTVNEAEVVEITPDSVSRVRDGSLDKLRRQLSGSLDNIVLKALRKEPQRRYQTVELLADDIRRYLDGLPVSAPAYYPPTMQTKIDASEAPTGIKTIAVLPFKMLRAEQGGDEYLGMGMADAIITKLSNIQRIVVRPTSSVIKYFDGEHNILTAGHELDVDFILDGRIQRHGDRMRVTVQLVRMSDGAPLWAAKFDENYTDIFTVEDSISEQVAVALMPRLSGQERERLNRRETDNPEASQAYMKGRFFWNKFTVEGFHRAHEHFAEAIRLDPNFAQAHVGIADYYNWASIFSLLPPRECYERAKAAATRALELDDSLAEAHAALAFTTLCYEWDWATAEAMFKRALELNQNYSAAHQWYSNLLLARKRFAEAIAESQQAQILNPLSLIDNAIVGWTLYQARRYDRAVASLRRTLEMEPNFGQGYVYLAMAYDRTDRKDEALNALRKSLKLMEGALMPLGAYGAALASSGQQTEARQVLAQLNETARQRYVSPYFSALIHAALGEHDAAFDCLDRSAEERDGWLIWLATEPLLDPLRRDARFDNLLRRVGHLPPTEQLLAATVPLTLPQTDERKEPESLGSQPTEVFAPISTGETIIHRSDPQPHVSAPPHVDPRTGENETRLTTAPTPLVVPPPTATARPFSQMVLAALVALLLLGGAGFGLYYKFYAPANASEVFRAVKSSRLTTTGNASNATVSPDGRYVAYVIEETGRQGVWMRQVAVANSVRIVPAAEMEIRGLTFARDGAHIYYVGVPKTGEGKSALYQVPTLGGAVKKIKDGVDGPVGFSPNGERFAFVRKDAAQGLDTLLIANADGGGEQSLVSRKFPEHISTFSAPAWAPDAEQIAFVVESSDANGFLMKPVAARLADRTETSLSSQRWLDIGQMAWLAGGSELLMAAQDPDSSFVQLWHLHTRGGAAHKITNDLSDYKGVSLTSDAKSLVTVQRQMLTNIWIAPKGEANRPAQITSGAGRYFDLSWAPDGKVLYASDVTGSADLWEVEDNGAEPKQLTAGAARNYSPVATPDNRFIVFHSNRSGAWQIWRMERDGSNARQLTTGDEDSNWPQISPDSRWIVYEHTGAESLPTVWRVSLEGGTPQRLTSGLSIRPIVSPDGKMLAYWHKEAKPEAPWRILISPLEGGEAVKSFDVPQSLASGNTSLRWTPDGRALAFIDFRNGVTNLWLQPIAGGPPQKLTDYANDMIYSFDFAPDGRIVFSRGLRTIDVVLINDTQQ
ncbi:MAG TPA: protein kinase [Pyrinomonadaceae bacterium]|jgi:serine/threonine protein kinase/Tol biopolymer transport system component/tetratricopeptide (TPR) repeat protein|nr:protein kinase [Pyrinomonadaceae bacterium]